MSFMLRNSSRLSASNILKNSVMSSLVGSGSFAQVPFTLNSSNNLMNIPVGVRAFGVKRNPKGIPGRVLKKARKEKSRYFARAVRFAGMFDPMHTAKQQLCDTLDYMGWEYFRNEEVDGNILHCTSKDWFVHFEIVDGKHFVLPDDPNASNDYGFGPGRPTPVRALGSKQNDFPHLPHPWENPCYGLVLDKETFERQELLRAKSWKIVTIPLPLWEFMVTCKDQHRVRRDWISFHSIYQFPFEPRPVEVIQQVEQQISVFNKSRRLKLADKELAAYKAEKMSVLEEECAQLGVAIEEVEAEFDALQKEKALSRRMAARASSSRAKEK